MTKALFFDIDGTLVSFETRRIPQKGLKYLSLPDVRKRLSTIFPNCRTGTLSMDI